MKDFDKEEEYDRLLSPLMTQIIEICREHEIPMFCSFQFRSTKEDEGDGYCTTHLGGPGHEVNEKFSQCFRAVRSSPQFATFSIVTKES